jgi:hypothetical protein
MSAAKVGSSGTSLATSSTGRSGSRSRCVRASSQPHAKVSAHDASELDASRLPTAMQNIAACALCTVWLNFVGERRSPRTTPWIISIDSLMLPCREANTVRTSGRSSSASAP